ncbi:unknown [Odoribacter sp. CAG:788]|nr:unknown [Odoribacter sp. CAG:788]
MSFDPIVINEIYRFRYVCFAGKRIVGILGEMSIVV